jgi:hypothetical protein
MEFFLGVIVGSVATAIGGAIVDVILKSDKDDKDDK